MIKEYIEELLNDNNEQLHKLEQQMKNLMIELDSAKGWLDSLNAESNVDTNIFSPRSMDSDLKRKTEEAQNNVYKIKQDIEYVSSFMETHIKKKEEYEKLLVELEEMAHSTEKETKETENRDLNEMQLTRTFLSDLYRKTELCLALLSSDRNRCKNELKNMKAMIRSMSEKISTEKEES